MKQFTIFSLFATALIALAGCSYDGTSTMPEPTKVTYTKGTTYTYYETRIDSSDAPIQGTGDTITSKVVVADTSLLGKSHVTILANTHSNGSANDTTYIAQDSGNFWHYNYGLESYNTNPQILSFNGGKPLVCGWVLQGKLTAQQGNAWEAIHTSIALPLGSIDLKDDAQEAADEKLTVNGATVTTKHSLHQVTASNVLLGSVSGPVDTYVAADFGVVRNVVHLATGTVNGGAIRLDGRQTILLKKS
jgi:hypothetical protein